MRQPLIPLDYPDPDVIRVGRRWYMATTTMHFFPGGEILTSTDLVHWEHAAFVFDDLGDDPAHRLEGGRSIYGQGMWAPTLRFHQGRFYLAFTTNDQRRHYLFTAPDITGPWSRRTIEGFHHDGSLLFDQGRVFLAWGATTIRLTELRPDLSGPLAGGLDRVVVEDVDPPYLGYEGSHLYRVGDRYHLFLIHSRRDRWRRVQACFSADSLEGPFTGGDVLDDDRGWGDHGVAQGGLTDDDQGRFWAVLFQDHGAVGRLPVLVPLTWDQGRPVLGSGGRIPEAFEVPPSAAGTLSRGLTGTAFADRTGRLEPWWQWNHRPRAGAWAATPRELRLRVARVSPHLLAAPNTLTQRLPLDGLGVKVTLDGRRLRAGDRAGLAVFQGAYAGLHLENRPSGWQLVFVHRPLPADPQAPWPANTEAGQEGGRVAVDGPLVTLGFEVSFDPSGGEVAFWWSEGGAERPIGPRHRLAFRLDHFCGARLALFCYGQTQTGGEARFRDLTFRTRRPGALDTRAGSDEAQREPRR